MSKSDNKKKIKTPIAYYGGKQNILKHILPLIPKHRIYVEPFFGGGAVYWAKEPSSIEIINDTNMNIINFYEVLKHSYFELRKRVESTLHSREIYKKALIIYDCPWLFADDPVIRAWAFYVLTNQGFAHKIGAWGYNRGKMAYTIQQKIDQFQEILSERLKYTQIEQNKAKNVIKSRDTPDTFVYADPPYVNSDQGHYGGYTLEHYTQDLEALAAMKGKFLLSAYPSETLNQYINEYGWQKKAFEKVPSANNPAKILKINKVELLIYNY
ncbi:DNA adenine methylase [Sinomicrobium pectinilyticum]|uniref:DNA adenine methylase n=1 Tax=Sinomicrobium pectinilyticum TaxID=1084421 RepID=A0A3N0EQP5_SINP1|nr:DNA adenine methylase [Sinomicrobium pectinilyticum]RNL90122.1 DNA adenine methylase [Sinomicrobium pectinilyticum]